MSASIVGEADVSRGCFVLAIDPRVVLGNDNFAQQVDLMLSRMRAGELVAGGDTIRLPGDASRSRMQACLSSGQVAIDSHVLGEIEKLVGDHAQ